MTPQFAGIPAKEFRTLRLFSCLGLILFYSGSNWLGKVYCAITGMSFQTCKSQKSNYPPHTSRLRDLSILLCSLFMEVPMFKGFVLGLAVTLLVAGGFASQKNYQKEKEAAIYQAEISKATPIELGVMTTKQQLHSKLYRGVGSRINGKSITETIAANKGKQVVLFTDILGREFIDPNEPSTAEYQFKKLVDSADVVIRGSVLSKHSQISEEDTFLFTDYEVKVSEALKDKSLAELTITVTSLGGEIMSENVIFKAGGTGIPLLPTNKEILLFLKFVPETGGYKLVRYNAIFEVEGQGVRPVSSFPVNDTALQVIRELSSN
jgi:hypothetical protein